MGGDHMVFNGIEHVKLSEWRNDNGLSFHSSWDWLMPVCQKIDKLLFNNIQKFGYNDECLLSNDIEVRYQAVIEFIKWYNENK